MIKDNLKIKMKQWDVLHPVLEFFIGGGFTFISSLFCIWLCQFSCEISLAEITTISAFVLFISLYAIIFSLATIVSGRIWLGNGIAMVFLFAVTMLDYQVYYFRGTGNQWGRRIMAFCLSPLVYALDFVRLKLFGGKRQIFLRIS